MALADRVSVLETECPVAVQHVKPLRKELGEFTNQVSPIPQELFKKLMGELTVPETLERKVKEVNKTIGKNYDAKLVFTGLPSGDGKYRITLDKEGNVCFPGNAQHELQKLQYKKQKQKRYDQSDFKSILEAVEILSKSENEEIKGKAKRFQQALKKIEMGVSQTDKPVKLENKLSDHRHLFKTQTTDHEEPTIHCNTRTLHSIDSKKTNLSAQNRTYDDIPVTEQEYKDDEYYGPGRFPIQTGIGVESGRCVPPDDGTFAKQHGPVASFYQKIRKANQSSEALNKRFTEYLKPKTEDIKEDVLSVLACVDLPNAEQCENDTDFEDYDGKLPYNYEKQEGVNNMKDICQWGKNPAQPSAPNQCYSRRFKKRHEEADNSSDINTKAYYSYLKNWYLKEIKGDKYMQWARQKQEDRKNKTQYVRDDGDVVTRQVLRAMKKMNSLK